METSSHAGDRNSILCPDGVPKLFPEFIWILVGGVPAGILSVPPRTPRPRKPPKTHKKRRTPTCQKCSRILSRRKAHLAIPALRTVITADLQSAILGALTTERYPLLGKSTENGFSKFLVAGGCMAEIPREKEYTPALWHPSFLGLSLYPEVTEQKSYGVYHFPG